MPISDPFAADILKRLADDMTGPMAAGARVESVPLGAGLTVELTAALREAAMFLALSADLDVRPLTVAVRLVRPTPARGLAPISFAGWSEAGSVVPLYLPVADPETEMVAPFRLKLTFLRAGAELSEAEAAALVEGRLVSGRLGRLMALLDAETVAIRRHARAVAAARSIETADEASLDRHGGDLGVPRQTARLTLAADGTVGTISGRELDADYRRRLAMYRAFAFPRPSQYTTRLDADGPLAQMGFAGRLEVREDVNPFSLAVALVSVGRTGAEADARANNFRNFLRRWVLVDPNNAPPAARPMSAADRDASGKLRERLRDFVELTATDAAMAPDLALGLDRAVALFKAVGVEQKLKLVRALDPGAGTRYGLGLGLGIAPLTAATLDTLFTTAGGPVPAGASPDVLATFSALKRPTNVKDDPLGSWVWRACGFRTVYLAEAGELFLSHLATGALTLAGDTSLVLPAAGQDAAGNFLASFVPEAGTATSKVIAAATAAAAAALPGTLPSANDAAVLAAAMPAGRARGVRLRAAGLPAIEDWQPVREALSVLDAQSYVVLELPTATTTGLANGAAAAWMELSNLAQALRQVGAAAALPLFTAGAAAMVVATTALPIAGANLAGRASSGFRWFAIPIDKPTSRAQDEGNAPLASLDRRTGATTTLRVRAPGLYALVALGYQHLGGTDPYEVRIEAGTEDLLTYMQYEFLMNLLALRYPAGVEINTWPIRRFHVASDDGTRTALDPFAARTWRPFRRQRRAGTP
ncbi:hypothetical protein [Sinorhizobium meliloti]|uniref:Uncharacterized protein n=1 Tax=Rhizobium meliloti TaxID=382 RepID=A0A2J0YT15_RHIML|nr:hypothetical protein [Sinorhizobium meliloti]PJR08735.1 hypothetical protein CEJ86_32465 [Sinorhizobium meliloti]